MIPIRFDSTAPYAPKRYIGLRFVVGTAALTNGTGQFSAAIVKDIQQVRNMAQKSGFTVS